jgi:hypothetical protein
MQVQINYAEIQNSPALTEYLRDLISRTLAHAEKLVTRVEVHIHDDKHGRRGQDDTRCTIQVNIAGEKPLAVQARARDIYAAASQSARKAGRAVTHRIARLRSRK